MDFLIFKCQIALYPPLDLHVEIVSNSSTAQVDSYKINLASSPDQFTSGTD